MQQMLWTEFRWLHTENDWPATLLLAMRRRLAVCHRCTLRVSMSEDMLLPLVHEWNMMSAIRRAWSLLLHLDDLSALQ